MNFEAGVQDFLENMPAAAADAKPKVLTEEEKQQQYLDEFVPVKLEKPSNFFMCFKVKQCGHKCRGIKGETTCLPCLEPECIAKNKTDKNLPDKSELCNICYTSELHEEPSVRLGCNHIFHAECVRKLLRHRWNSMRITFSFMDCPCCK